MSFFDGVRRSKQERQARIDNELRAQQTARQNQIAEQNYLMAQERAKRDQAEWDQKQADRNFLMGGSVTPDALRQRGMFTEANYMETAAQKKAEEAERQRKDRDAAAVTWITNTANMTPEQRSDLYQKSLPQLVQRFGQGNLPEVYSEDWYQSMKAAFTKPAETKGVKFAERMDKNRNTLVYDANTGTLLDTVPPKPDKPSAADTKALNDERRDQAKIAANDQAIEESRQYMVGKSVDDESLKDPVFKANYMKANETKSTGDWNKRRYNAAKPLVGKVGTDEEIRSAVKSLAGQGYSKAQIKEILKAAGAGE